MMTENEFVKQCFNHTSGVIALGTVAARPMLAGKLTDADSLGTALGNLNQTTIELLRHLYRVLNPQPEKKNEPPQPGTPQAPNGGRK